MPAPHPSAGLSTGNVVLKTSEGLVETVEALLGDELRFATSDFMHRVGQEIAAAAAPQDLQ